MDVSYDFSDKVAVVTGAARGVGRSIVEAMVQAGARVVAADRDGSGLAETCRPHGDAALAVIADVSSKAGSA